MRFFHGSNDEIQVGSIWVGQGEAYEKNWSGTEFYAAIEKHRPSNMLAHKDAVFMVGHPDDIDLAGGGTEWACEMKPLAPVSKHDLNWSSEISCLISDGLSIDSPEVRQAAENYWAGVAHPNESVWEYLTAKAEIIRVEPYEEFELDFAPSMPGMR
jgi:hypothetical protein